MKNVNYRKKKFINSSYIKFRLTFYEVSTFQALKEVDSVLLCYCLLDHMINALICVANLVRIKRNLF